MPLTDTQLVVLFAALAREDGLIFPLPTTPQETGGPPVLRKRRPTRRRPPHPPPERRRLRALGRARRRPRTSGARRRGRGVDERVESTPCTVPFQAPFSLDDRPAHTSSSLVCVPRATKWFRSSAHGAASALRGSRTIKPRFSHSSARSWSSISSRAIRIKAQSRASPPVLMTSAKLALIGHLLTVHKTRIALEENIVDPGRHTTLHAGVETGAPSSQSQLRGRCSSCSMKVCLAFRCSSVNELMSPRSSRPLRRSRSHSYAPISDVKRYSTCLAVFCMRRIRAVSSRRRAIASFVKRP